MRRLSADERAFLIMLRCAGGTHLFDLEDKVTAERHRMLRSLDRRGYIAVSKVDGWERYRADLTALGAQEIAHG